MFSEQLLSHFRDPRNVGELDPPAVVVEVFNPACGDQMRLSARIEDGCVVEARYKTRGCTASIATGSALAEWLPGKTLENLAALKATDIEALIGGLAYETRHAAILCLDAVKALLKERARQG